MPATRLDPKRKRDPLRELIAGRRAVAGLGVEQFGDVMGWGRNKAARMLADVDAWALSDLKRACRVLNISIDELRQAIRY